MLQGVTGAREIYDIFANDQRAIDNKGIIGYDNSPEVLKEAARLQERIHADALRVIAAAKIH